MNKRHIQLTCLLFVVVLLISTTGCTVGPEYVRPETAADTDEGFFNTGKHNQDITDLDSMYRWWERFADETTAYLVRQALVNNYDIKASASRVIQAQAFLAQSKGAQLPSLTYNVGRARSKSSFNFGTGRISPLVTTFSQDFTASYLLDLFGKLKHAERAAWSDMLAAQASEQAIANSIIASVIISRVQIATLQKQLEIAKANTASRKDTMQIVERRYSEGLVGPVDVRLARENLASSQALEPKIESLLIQAQHALDVLLGRRPGSSASLPTTLPELPNLEAVPIGLPASLLDRRPDVLAAELSLRSANELVGVSIAQLYPDLTLTGMVGRNADRWRDLWIDETEVYSAITHLAQPVFNGGQIRAQIEASKARYEELAYNYASTVLDALKEVEDSLVSEEKLQAQLMHVEFQVGEALAAENLSRERYQRGVEVILTVLESERRRRLAETELAILKGDIWINRVNLFLALGGDWGNLEKTEERGN
ncbi:MAG: efflux transporter outer membrane subunit [Planctomycetota bacterium]